MRFLSRAVLFTYNPITRLTGRLLFARAIRCIVRAVRAVPSNCKQLQKVRFFEPVQSFTRARVFGTGLFRYGFNYRNQFGFTACLKVDKVTNGRFYYTISTARAL